MRRLLLPLLIVIIALTAGIYVGYITARQDNMPKGPVIRIDFLDADLGNGALVRTPEHECILIDPGSRRTAVALAAYLQDTGVKSLEVIVTNPTANRGGALETIISRFKVKRILRGEKTGSSGEWKRAIDYANEHNVPQTNIRGGDMIRLSRSTKLEVLSPPPGLLSQTDSDSDSNSLVVRLTFKGKRFLFTSDAGGSAQNYLVKSGIDLQSNVLAISKAAKSDAITLEFLSRVRPEQCILSSSRHPNRVILQRIDPKNTGAALHRTDKDGTISIISDGRTIITNTIKERP
ncbi:hypothetical protein LLG46_05635 [bacterium]|nr:hypothetical protein [bacterium]